jgi:hypothetical protein
MHIPKKVCIGGVVYDVKYQVIEDNPDILK